jgi:HD-GYP domain-containing protein (c-di-GMP phosphodiesterase class II)
MVRDFGRVQDLVLVLVRWAILAGVGYASLDAEELLVPIPLLGALALYSLVMTILYIGAWAGSRSFAHIQSVGDLALVALAYALPLATGTPGPGLVRPAYVALLVVAVLIGMRRFSWPHTMAYAAVALVVGFLAETAGLDVLPGPVEPIVAAVVVVLARLLAGDPLPADFLEKRPPVRTDQVRALQALGKLLGERSDHGLLIREAHRIMLAHTGATRAAVVLLDDGPEEGHIHAVLNGDLQSKPIVAQRTGSTPAERALREGRVRVVRQKEPLPIPEILGEPGASSFVGVALRAGGETLGALLAYDKEGGRPFTEEDEAFLDLLAPALASSFYGGRAATEAAQTADIFPRGLLGMLALQRPEAEVHAEQVARFAVAVGEQLELPHDEMMLLHLGALLHDVGELGVDGLPFNKSQMLSNEEYQNIREHPWIGARLLATLDQPPDILDMVHQHHERWDGTGYPQQLARADVVRAARILAVADALDAMTAKRPYRAPRPVREALQELVANSGTQFDPAVVQALLAVVARHGENWVAAPSRRQRPAIEPWSGRVRRF